MKKILIIVIFSMLFGSNIFAFDYNNGKHIDNKTKQSIDTAIQKIAENKITILQNKVQTLLNKKKLSKKNREILEYIAYALQLKNTTQKVGIINSSNNFNTNTNSGTTKTNDQTTIPQIVSSKSNNQFDYKTIKTIEELKKYVKEYIEIDPDLKYTDKDGNFYTVGFSGGYVNISNPSNIDWNVWAKNIQVENNVLLKYNQDGKEVYILTVGGYTKTQTTDDKKDYKDFLNGLFTLTTTNNFNIKSQETTKIDYLSTFDLSENAIFNALNKITNDNTKLLKGINLILVKELEKNGLRYGKTEIVPKGNAGILKNIDGAFYILIDKDTIWDGLICHELFHYYSKIQKLNLGYLEEGFSFFSMVFFEGNRDVVNSNGKIQFGVMPFSSKDELKLYGNSTYLLMWIFNSYGISAINEIVKNSTGTLTEEELILKSLKPLNSKYTNFDDVFNDFNNYLNEVYQSFIDIKTLKSKVKAVILNDFDGKIYEIDKTSGNLIEISWGKYWDLDLNSAQLNSSKNLIYEKEFLSKENMVSFEDKIKIITKFLKYDGALLFIQKIQLNGRYTLRYYLFNNWEVR